MLYLSISHNPAKHNVTSENARNIQQQKELMSQVWRPLFEENQCDIKRGNPLVLCGLIFSAISMWSVGKSDQHLNASHEWKILPPSPPPPNIWLLNAFNWGRRQALRNIPHSLGTESNALKDTEKYCYYKHGG